MSDYGHDLVFGTFITPTALQPQQAVSLAKLTERSGLDLVTFQDHPYQPAFLDTWTLLSYAAAVTERVHLSANVINLPLRPPAVLARSAASLDLLSGGRVELGVGAGAFWDAIAAMGGRRLSPGNAVEALEEAIAVVRATWDTDQRGGVIVHGNHYQVVGAKRGPAPAHDIPIWVGALKPRMLRLVGRAADGWLPSLSYLGGPQALADANAIIDDAATTAGREPSAVRRLLNVADADPRLLADLALEHGVSAFILAADDPDSIRAFGQDVAPAVRELVRAGRGVDTLQADDATQLATPWDESTRPSRAPAPADREYTDRGRGIGQHLVDVHDSLRTELQQVRDLVDQVRSSEVDVAAARSTINAMTLRQNNWTLGTYCESYCRIVTGHHSLEDDGIFPHLRRSDPGLSAVLDRLQAEHHAIHEILEGVDQALVDLVSGAGDHTGLAAAVDLMTQTLLSHFAYEERELVEPLTRHGMYAGQA